MWYHEAFQFSEVSANRWGILQQKHLPNLPVGHPECQINDSLFDARFPTFQFYLLTCEVTRVPNFRKAPNFQKICKRLMTLLLTRLTLWFSVKSFCEKVWISWVPCVKFGPILLSRLKIDKFHFWKLISVVKSNFDRYDPFIILLLYMCQISDPLFEVWFPICHFYPSKCDITRPSNFRKFLQIVEEYCNRNICQTFR